MWKTNVPPTVKFFAWRVATNSLSTWPNKKKRCLEGSDLCPICQREPEHTFHALRRCQNSVNLWSCMSTIWPLQNLGDVHHNGPEWLLHALQPLSENVRCMQGRSQDLNMREAKHYFDVKNCISPYVKLSIIASMIKHKIMVHNYTKNDKSQQTVGK